MASRTRQLSLHELDRGGSELLSSLHSEIFPPDTGERWQCSELAAILGQKTSLCIVATLDEIPVGYGLLRFAPEECELLSFGVLREARRQGIASRLLERVFLACRERGVWRLFLEVREDNMPARRFYAGKGLRPVGLRPEYYRGKDGQNTDAITMAFDF